MKLRKLLLWLATVSYMVGIFYLSSLSNPVRHDIPYGMDKLVHFIIYSILGFLVSSSLRSSGIKGHILIGCILASTYGLTDEIHQSFVPMRDASLGDFIMDSLGSFAGAYFTRLTVYKANNTS